MALMRENRNGEMNFNDVLNLLQNVIMSEINCHNVGKIIAFDPLTQRCTVQLMQIKQFNERFFTPAPITNVPLIIYGTANAQITLPDPTGSICLLLFLDRNIDSFLETGEQYVPETTRLHDFTDCVAITTFSTLATSLENYDEQAISLLNKEILENIQNNSYIKVNPNNTIITASSSNVSEDTTVTSSVLVNSNSVEIVNTVGGKISISDKINIQNESQNLVSLISELLTACESIVTINGGALTSTSKQLFTDLKTKFEELLQ